MTQQKDKEINKEIDGEKAGRIMLGCFCIICGLLWVLSNYDMLPFDFNLSKLWPIVFIFIGIAVIFGRDEK